MQHSSSSAVVIEGQCSIMGKGPKKEPLMAGRKYLTVSGCQISDPPKARILNCSCLRLCMGEVIQGGCLRFSLLMRRRDEGSATLY